LAEPEGSHKKSAYYNKKGRRKKGVGREEGGIMKGGME